MGGSIFDGPQQGGRQVTVITASVLLGFYALIMLIKLSRQETRLSIQNAVLRLRARVRRPPVRIDGGNMETKITEYMKRERLRWTRHFASVGLYVLAPCVCLTVLVSALNLSDLTDPTASEAVLRSSVSAMAALTVLCLAWTACPRLVNAYVLDFIYVALTAWWIGNSVFFMQVPDTKLGAAGSYVPRVLAAIVTQNAGLCSLCNIAMTIALCLVFSAQGFHHAIPAEIILTEAIIMFLFVFEQWVWSSAQYTLEIKASSQTEVTVRRLLSALCDAVVTLGADLRVSERAPKLANLLLQDCSTGHLEGTLFLDFMADTDQVRFRQFIARAPDWVDCSRDPEPAQALNVHLRDASGIGVQVQLFHSHFRDVNDEVGHLIGICEVGDAGPCLGRAAPQLQRIASHLRTSRSSEQAAESVSSKNITDVDSDTSQLGDSASVTGVRSLEERRVHASLSYSREVLMTFDTMRFMVNSRQGGSPVVDASLLTSDNLLQWVAEWPSCRAWLQDFVNAALRPVNASTWPAGAGQPSSVVFHVSFRGLCNLPPDILSRPAVVANEAGVDGVAVAQPARLKVSRVQVAKRRPKRRSNSSPSPRRPAAAEGMHAASSGTPRATLLQPTLLGVPGIEGLRAVVPRSSLSGLPSGPAGAPSAPSAPNAANAPGAPSGPAGPSVSAGPSASASANAPTGSWIGTQSWTHGSKPPSIVL